MTLDEAIQSFEDEMEKQIVLGHPEHIDNLEQMADWQKELKAYREIWSKLGMWLADTRLAIAPDETVNDVDEKLVRVAQVDMIDTVLEWMDKQEV